MHPTHKIAVLLACHNRADITIRGLLSLQNSIDTTPGLKAEIFLVDDGSTDGTTKKVTEKFPHIHVIQGDGTLFWNGGMCLAYQHARKHDADFDAYVLFNDDVQVIKEKFHTYMDDFFSMNIKEAAILASAMKAPDSESFTYSGYRRTSKFRPLALSRVYPNSSLQRCDTFNGNLVTLPADFFHEVDGLDPAYHHAYGDIDLGFVAGQNGVAVYLAPEAVGICEANTPISARLSGKTLTERRKILFGASNPVRDYIHFVRKHGHSVLWPILVTRNVASRLVQMLKR